MNRFRIAGRLAVIVAGLAGALAGLGAAAVPAAVAATMLPLGGDPHGRPGLARLRPAPAHPALPAHAHAVVTGGISGWQIALIAAGAAVLAAVLAVLADRTLAARRHPTAPAAEPPTASAVPAAPTRSAAADASLRYHPAGIRVADTWRRLPSQRVAPPTRPVRTHP